MELLHALLLVALPALCCFNVSAALYYQDTFIRGRDKVTAHDIYLEVSLHYVCVWSLMVE